MTGILQNLMVKGNDGDLSSSNGYYPFWTTDWGTIIKKIGSITSVNTQLPPLLQFC